ncbi:MAG: hypothetical protein A7316_07480 [Candidatus Altiarchaeales archaeon WOR_SM1_86-2]|nr:MAG: hypothetical protein A7315_05130 [Candidatus Altiarchaeales archaeon WOR_SM1_79]ODS38654.1 MAG: hypothetical protein A7316_07480 [Candidatus Altiarchaeales archaeon WOR_SM1_86-2]
MKKIFLLSLVVLILVCSQLASAGELKPDLSGIIANAQANENIPVIIFFYERPMTADIRAIRSDGASVKYHYEIINAVAAQVPAEALDDIAKRDFVKLVEPDYRVELVLDNSTPQIQADRVWGANITGKEINVAIIDTGIHDEHPDLTIDGEVDYTGEGTDDLHGHGTHVAGTVASTNSTYRGVACDADLFNVKALNQHGYGHSSNIIMGIEWAVNNGAEVISMSLGAQINPCDGTDAMSQAVDNAVTRGVVVVVSAGNNGTDNGTITSPGCSRKAITVGAVDDNDNVAAFSSRGPTGDGRVKPDLLAPGVSITSTWNDNSFRSSSGTSIAAPHVSGVAALLLEADSSLAPDDVKNILMSTALDLGLNQNIQGVGRVDAYGAVNNVSQSAANCSSDSECDDANECTADTCVNPGTIGAHCSHSNSSDNTNCAGGICCSGICAAPVCSLDSDCSDGDPCTTDACGKAGTCSASCSNTGITACIDNDGCCPQGCGSTNDNDCQGDGGTDWWLIILIAAAVIILVVIIYFVKRRS